MRNRFLLLLIFLLLCPLLASAEGTPGAETYLDLGEEIYSLDALTALLDARPELTRVDMFATVVEKPEITRLAERYPQITFGWTIHIPGRSGGHTVRTDQTAFSTLHGNCNAHTSEELEVLQYCTALKALDLGHNILEDISFLKDLTELRVLILACNRITDLSPLAGMKNLEYIELFSNSVSDLSPLYNLPRLEDINVSYLELTDAETLTHFPAARRLWVSKCMQGKRFLRKADQQMLRALYPDAVLTFQGEPTQGGWRRHPHYEVIKESFETGIYRPFDD